MVMPSLHQALDRDVILRAISSFYGITTADGNIGGTTLFCSTLIGANDFISDKTILLQSGLSIYEHSGATAFNPVNGGITVDSAFSSQVLEGTSFYVLNAPTVDIAPILAALGISQGLCYYGVVTAIPGPNEFAIDALIGLGDAKFIDLAGIYPYYAFVLRDAGGPGAAPQGEAQPITNYGSATGGFLTNPFTDDVAVDDEMLIIHPFLARIMNLAGLPPHVGSLAANWQAAEANIVQIGADNVKYKLHSLVLDINALVGTVTIRMYQEVVGVERRVYQQTFTVAADGPGLWIINGTVGIHEVLRVTAQSDNAADNDKAIGYDYLLEAM